MSINLSISFSCPGSISQQVSYARIDNTTTPTYIQAANITGSEGNFVIASNIPDGQYIVSRTPIFADGRVCAARTYTTPGCSGLISISAVIQSGVLVVTYLAPSGAPSVLINVNYPNGGSFSQIYTNTGNPISIGLHVGVFGNYSVTGQSVCDASSGFYSPPSATVSVNYAQAVAGSYYLGNTVAAACAAGVTTLYSNGSPVAGTSVLYQDEAMQTPVVGYLYVLYAGVIYNLSATNGQLGTDTGASCSPTAIVRNALSFMTISAITGVPGYSFTPTSGSFYQPGNHGAFTGAITVDFYGTVPVSPSFSINVYKNSVLQGCYNFSTGAVSGGYTTGTLNYAASDVLEIDIGTGSC